LLNITCLGKFLSEKITEFVVWLESTNCISVREDSFNIIVAETNTDVLNDVTRM